MTPEYFAHLAALIRENIDPGDDDSVLLSIPGSRTVLAALNLAPIAVAAIAYLDAPPLSGASWDAWEGLGRAVASYKETMK